MPRVMKLALIALAVSITIIGLWFNTHHTTAEAFTGTLTGTSTLSPNGALTVTVVANGPVKITAIEILNNSGVCGVIQHCRLVKIYINGTPSPLTPPWVLENGQSAVFIFNSTDCAYASQVLIIYR